MFVVSPFEIVYNFFLKKPTVVAHDGCMGRCLPPSMGHDGWPYRRGPQRLDSNVVGHGAWWSKLINFKTVV
jgi:hypothetical protein